MTAITLHRIDAERHMPCANSRKGYEGRRNRFRDTALDGRGYILVFDDSDVKRFLAAVSESKRRGIDVDLTRRLNALLS